MIPLWDSRISDAMVLAPFRFAKSSLEAHSKPSGHGDIFTKGAQAHFREQGLFSNGMHLRSVRLPPIGNSLISGQFIVHLFKGPCDLVLPLNGLAVVDTSERFDDVGSRGDIVLNGF